MEKDKSAVRTRERSALILEIRGNSLDDGPGIRSVVFFKGCPLSCLWCHNPESKRVSVEIAHDAMECVGCGSCISVCAEGALSKKNARFIDRARCTLCFKCTEVCPSGALSRVGREMPVDEVLREALRDKPFFDTSGGGVTLSGGEPAMHMEYAARLLRALKENGVHTLIETCGYFEFGEFETMLLPYLDTVYFDVKIIDSRRHRAYTGAGNERILENLQGLHRIAAGSSFSLLPRTPLVPGITDTEENLEGIARFLRGLGMRSVMLLPYNPLWREKAAKLGIEHPDQGRKEMTRFMDKEWLRRCSEIFIRAGMEPV